MYGQQQPGFGQSPGFGQPPPQGYGQPMQQQQYMPPPIQQGPTVIHVAGNNDSGTPCPFCGTDTDHIPRKKIGCVTIAWACCLFYFTGFLCCIPCCMDGCKDTELVCIKCHQPKMTIQANCC
eukprot:GHVR01124965.1.p1 GENE.GHVR01124965.1~~GHVR01124965.1.p1  ORF type:complete len:122 (+),score=14.47 GHVR01124965.1:389-754(+)